MTYLVLFAAGVAQDFVVTAWTRAVARKQAGIAAVLAGVVTLVTMLLLANVILVDHDRVPRVLALAAGNVLGTFLVIRGEERLSP